MSLITRLTRIPEVPGGPSQEMTEKVSVEHGRRGSDRMV